MAKPPVFLPSFSHFAEASSPFFQLAMCSFSKSFKKSKEQEDEATGFPSSPFYFLFSPFLFFFVVVVVPGVDSGVRDFEFVVPKGAVRSIQVADLQTTQRVEGSLTPTSGDTTMGEAPGVATLDPASRLPTFLAHFDLLEFNGLPTSHFHHFGPSYDSFLLFFMPVEGLPLLEGLFKSHGDFTSGFKGGVFLGNILMELLHAVLISMRDSSLDSLFEEKFLEWRGVVQDLLKAKFNLSFLLEHLRSLAHMLFQRQASRSIDTVIVAAEEALVRAHKILQDLKVER